MFVPFRNCDLCSELVRTHHEIVAFSAIPAALRPRRAETHRPTTTDDYVENVANVINFAGGPDLAPPLPWSAEFVLSFVKHAIENAGWPIPKVLAHQTAVNSYHISNHLEPPRSWDLTFYFRMLRKEHQVRRAVPFTTENIQRICDRASLHSPLRAARDRALILVAFASAMRPSEVARIHRSDVEAIGPSYRLHIPASKGDRLRTGQAVPITPASNPAYCPVTALRTLLTLNPGNYPFSEITRNGKIGHAPLHVLTVIRLCKTYGNSVGVFGRVTGYSPRRGFATAAAARGAEETKIQKHLRHKRLSTTRIYIDDVPLSFDQSLTRLVLG